MCKLNKSSNCDCHTKIHDQACKKDNKVMYLSKKKQCFI